MGKANVPRMMLGIFWVLIECDGWMGGWKDGWVDKDFILIQ